MKDFVEFPVVGAKYTPAGTSVSSAIELGDLLTLVPDAANPADPDAIKVYWHGRWVGYVPNRGSTCRECLTAVPKFSKWCPNCGASDVVPGGLATRLRKVGAFERSFLVHVSENQEGWITATLIFD